MKKGVYTKFESPQIGIIQISENLQKSLKSDLCFCNYFMMLLKVRYM